MRKMVREARQNPGAFAGEEAGGMVQGVFVVPLIFVAGLCALFFILGFTSLILKPYLFFKIFFWITLAGLGVGVLAMRMTVRAIKKVTAHTTRAMMDAAGEASRDG